MNAGTSRGVSTSACAALEGREGGEMCRLVNIAKWLSCCYLNKLHAIMYTVNQWHAHKLTEGARCPEMPA